MSPEPQQWQQHGEEGCETYGVIRVLLTQRGKKYIIQGI